MFAAVYVRGPVATLCLSLALATSASAECITAIGEVERRQDSPQAIVLRDAPTMLSVIFRDNNQTITKSMSFLCAPDTVDPRGPKGTK